MLAGLPPAKGLDVLTLSIALALALLSGLFKLGFIANLLDRPVASSLSTLASLSAVIISILVVFGLDLDQQGVKVVVHIPSGLPTLVWPQLNWLLVSALMP
tara:strand:- start:7 stop:309 length:303 start_codon:yes stop_codon:yes gene_type:complete